MLALTIALAASPAHAQSLPTGGQVTAGNASISTSGSNLTVNQTSRNAIISWQGFSVGGGASAHFENGTGATLNRVTGNLPSAIDGSLTATGSLYLINPAGVAVGSGGMVRTGGSFVASTHDAADADFLDGGALTLKGDSKAAVVNRGFVTSLSGDVVLTARRVENAGTIEAPDGSVGLLGGYEVELRDTSLADGKFAVKIGGPDTQVVNTGTVRAAEIEMRANGGSVQALAGNTKAIVKATGVKKTGGRIFLTAGDNGYVEATQTIVARKHPVAALPDVVPIPAPRPDFEGGEVRIAGGSVTLGGTIDASGSGAAGGTVVAVAQDALVMEDGARLDASGSSGGFIETSGHTVDFTAARIDASGASGPAGTWLIDPEDLTVDAASAATISSALDTGTSTTLQTTATSASGTGIISSGSGDITVAAPIAWGSGATLTLDAYHSISIDAPMTISGDGGLDLTTNSNNGAGDGTLSFTGGVQFTGTPNSGQGLTINGNGYTLLYDMAGVQDINNNLDGRYALAQSLDATGVTWTPLGTDGTGYPIGFGFTGTFTGLGNTISNLTVDTGDAFAGMFGYSVGAISDIGLVGGSVTGGDYVGGLVGRQNGGSIGRSYATGSVTGNGYVGGLIGYLSGSLAEAYATGTVSGSSDYVGGLIGLQDGNGNITQTYATGAVTGTGDYVGGLEGGQYDGTISQSYATGAVAGASLVGGLVGYQGGSIAEAYATGTVSGGNTVGGLVGMTWGNITQAYATGAVTGSADIGGLVGWQNDGSITHSYATGAVTGTGDYIGGLVGEQDKGSITQAYATGAVTGYNVVGGLAGMTLGSITQSYATGAVNSNSSYGYVGGLVGYQSNDNITASFFDSYSTGRASGVGYGSQNGVTAVSSDPASNSAYSKAAYTISGWTFTDTAGGAGDWTMMDGQTRPFGAWEYSTTIANSHQLQLVNMDLNASYSLAHSLDLAGEFGRAGVATPSAAQSAGMWSGGFVPLGTDGAGNLVGFGFTGTFAGLGNTIANLTIDIGSNSYAGLFGWSSATISDTGLVGGSVSGGEYVGGLVGYQNGGSITRAYATGAVTGTYDVGGLVGYQNGGSITQSFATGTVTGTGDDVGGLVGTQQNNGAVTQAYAIGAVNGDYWVGGLVGYQKGTVSQSYATGAVTGPNYVGGLVGEQIAGTVSDSYFDKDTTGQSSAYGNGGTGATALSSNGGSTFDKTKYAGFDWTVWAPPSEADAGGKPAYYPELYGVSGVVGVDYGGDITVTYGDASPSIPVPTYRGIGWFNSWVTEPDLGSFVATDVGTYTVAAAFGAVAEFWPGGASRIVSPDTVTITPATLTVTANDASKVYGDDDPTLSFAANGWKLSDNGTLLSGTLDRAAGEDVGTYAIGKGDLSAGGNYTIAYTGANLVIAPATLSITADAASKVYGDDDPALNFATNGWKLSDGDALLSGGLDRVAGEDVGTYAIGKGDLSAGGNYTIAYTGANLVIAPATLSITADAASKVYGDDDPALNFATNGWKLTDGGTLLSGTLDRAAGEDVGTYAIGKGDLSAGGNYTIAYTGANLVIAPATLTVTAANASKIYGETAALSGFVVSGLQNGESIGAVTLASDGAAATAGVTGSPYAITASGASGGTFDAANYTINYVDGTLTVTPRTITVTADDLSRLQGQPDPALTWTITGGTLASFDTTDAVFSGSLARNPGEAVGSYAIGQGTLAANANYTLSYVGGVLTIGPAAVTQSQVLERSADGQQFFVAASEGDDNTSTKCAGGILGSDCAAFVNPGNRDLGPHISWQAP